MYKKYKKVNSYLNLIIIKFNCKYFYRYVSLKNNKNLLNANNFFI